MKQVFINLILNAKEAMVDGGKLEINTTRFNDHKVKVVFQDTGIGIPLKYRDKIFDPFFTTRQDSKGTGIGLSIVHSSIQRNHGKIAVESKEGEGSRFILELPTISDE